jgi:integrase
MPSIKRRGNSCTIEVSNGVYTNGKRIRPSLTIEREPYLTDKQWEKFIQSKAVEFEAQVKNGKYLDGNKITFAEFVDIWRERYAQKELAPKTLYEYERHLKRIIQAIGHMKMSKIQPLHILQFYSNLAESGVREDVLYQANTKLVQYLNDNGIDFGMLATLVSINKNTAKKIINGERTNKAPQICMSMNIPLRDYFCIVDKDSKLSQRTIHHHHSTLNSILQKAVEWQMIYDNPARRVSAPKVSEKNMRFLEEEDVFRMFLLLENESIKHKAWIYTATYLGCRLGELGGLQWDGIDFNNNLISIHQASQALPGKGIFIKEPKNPSSKRVINIAPSAIKVLREYQVWQKEQQLIMGQLWIQTGFVFTKDNGEIMYPSTPTQWFVKFRRKNNLPDVNFHGLRHTNAAILIGEGVDIQTVAGRLGHAKPTTTAKVYSHFLKKPDEKASQLLEDKFNKKKEKDNKQPAN